MAAVLRSGRQCICASLLLIVIILWPWIYVSRRQLGGFLGRIALAVDGGEAPRPGYVDVRSLRRNDLESRVRSQMHALGGLRNVSLFDELTQHVLVEHDKGLFNKTQFIPMVLLKQHLIIRFFKTDTRWFMIRRELTSDFYDLKAYAAEYCKPTDPEHTVLDIGGHVGTTV